MSKAKIRYIERQTKWAKSHGIVEGKEVIVFKKAKDCQGGWEYLWIDEMKYPALQEIKTIYQSGIELKSSKCIYPYFCLKTCMTLKGLNYYLAACKITHPNTISNMFEKIWMYHEGELKQCKQWENVKFYIEIREKGFTVRLSHDCPMDTDKLRFFF